MNSTGNDDGEFGQDSGMDFGELKDQGSQPDNPYFQSRSVHTGYQPVAIKSPFSPAKATVTPSHQPQEPPPPTTPTGILVNAICFLSIMGVAALICFLQNQPVIEEVKTSPQADLFELMYQGKMQLGLKVLAENSPELGEQSQQRIDFGYFGSVRMRQAGAVLLAELESHDDALAALWQLETIASQQNYPFTVDEKRTTTLLTGIYDGSSDSLTANDRAHLEKELLWFGRLALNAKPKWGRNPDSQDRQNLLDDARILVMRLIGVGLTIVFGILVGLIGCISFLVIYANGNLTIGTRTYSKESSIFLESFLVWILSYFVFSLMMGVVAPQINPLMANAIVFFGSLGSSLFWPVLRGKFNAEFRKEIGFTGNPLRELPVSIWCYICSLPLIAIGFLITRSLASAFAEPWGDELTSTAPAHPMMEWVMQDNLMTIVGVFFVACVCAPIVEETCFRGFLYRAIKDNSHGLGHFLSSLIAATVNGLLFAAIHPQGIFFIPALCALGMAFSFAREWRGSLWTPMFMHAIHNFLVTLAVILFVAS